MKKIFAGTNGAVSVREKRNAALAREIACEGMVILKNDGVLPVKTKNIALFGSGGRKTVKGGTGSGSVNERHSVSIEEGLLAAGYNVTTTDWLDRFDAYYDKLYTEWKDAREKEIVGITDIIQILGIVGAVPFIYPNGIAIEKSDIAAANTDTAIYVLARQVGEGADRSIEKGDFTPADIEIENIQKLVAKFKKVIVVVNAGSQIDTSEIEKLGINALVFFGQGGQEGGHAFADIISGKVNPSGKLTFSWCKSYADMPFGDKYGAMGNVLEQDYLEDIYVGYRYYDTFGVKPAYPFGFGLSYTSFEVCGSNVAVDGESVCVRGSVKNTGKRDGKEVVQIYVTVPFGTDGAEYQRLVGYVKTPLIKAGGKYNFEIKFEIDGLTRYDEKRAAFMLTKGEYIVRVGNSSQNTTPIAILTLDRDVIKEQCVNICPLNKKLDVLRAPERKSEKNDCVKIALDANAIKTIAHDYMENTEHISSDDTAVLNAMPVEDIAKLVVGGGYMGDKVVAVFGSSGSTTSELYDKYGIPNIVMLDGPGGLNVANKFTLDKNGDFMSQSVPPAYDFGMFGQTIRDAIANAGGDGVVHYQYATAWPNGNILAQTWNEELFNKFGVAIADEMTEFGASVWLAPGMNIQKNPLCGRNFEYYSEDPFVSGTVAAAVTCGVQSMGKAVSIKHFCCNNVECERLTSSSNLSERALREVYLKGFQIAVERSKPKTVMSSYNKVNGVYNCNNADLLVKVLRDEWGFDGLVMTDWSGRGDAVGCIKAQNDLIMIGSQEEVQRLCDAVNSGVLSVEQLKRCAARVLKLIRDTAVISFAEA